MSFDSITVNGVSLRPAPYVSTSYEYFKSGDFNIGGLLIINLSGTIVSEQIESAIQQISDMMLNSDCVSVIIGCGGGSEFLNGIGRIRSVATNQGDQPFVASYTMVIAVETVDGEPAVKPDNNFLTQYGISAQDGQYLKEYSETLTIDGEGMSMGSFGGFGGVLVSSGFIRASGKIKIAGYGRPICGQPSINNLDSIKNILKTKATSLLSVASTSYAGLVNYSGWRKWLDTKNLTISKSDTSIEWTFNLYMTPQDISIPSAWIDVDITTKNDPKNKLKSFVANGTIRGLSSSTSTEINNKSCSNERIGNAQSAYSRLLNILKNGSWEQTIVAIQESGSGFCVVDSSADPCKSSAGPKVCYQRMNSNTSVNPVTGEITFSAEFGDIDSCKSQNKITLDVSVEDSLPTAIVKEIIVPSQKLSIFQQIAPDKSRKATITIRGNINGCDKTKFSELQTCVDSEMTKRSTPYNGWILTDDRETKGTYSIIQTKSYIQCNQNF